MIFFILVVLLGILAFYPIQAYIQTDRSLADCPSNDTLCRQYVNQEIMTKITKAVIASIILVNYFFSNDDTLTH